MNLDLIAEVWDALRSHIDVHEQADAADTLINLLIDNDFQADEIKDSFRGNKEVLKALKGYVEEHDTNDYEDFEDEDQDEEWD